jgi:chemotaxis protein MotA
MEQRHNIGSSIFMTMGGFSPTMGIIGTVMGLVMVLSSLGGNMTELGKGVAVAFIATFYGISFANLVFIPIANKLKEKNDEEVFTRELIIEGVLAIQAGDNPRIVEEKLRAFFPPRPEKEEEIREEGKAV